MNYGLCFRWERKSCTVDQIILTNVAHKIWHSPGHIGRTSSMGSSSMSLDIWTSREDLACDSPCRCSLDTEVYLHRYWARMLAPSDSEWFSLWNFTLSLVMCMVTSTLCMPRKVAVEMGLTIQQLCSASVLRKAGLFNFRWSKRASKSLVMSRGEAERDDSASSPLTNFFTSTHLDSESAGWIEAATRLDRWSRKVTIL